MNNRGNFHTPVMVCINKFDINLGMGVKIRRYCEENNLEIAGALPYDPVVTKAQLVAMSVVEHSDSPLSGEIRRMWKRVVSVLEKQQHE